MSLVSKSAAALAALACIVHASPAAAEPTSWLAFGGGYGLAHDDEAHRMAKGTALSFTLGVGTDPTNRVVVGGLLRSTTYVGVGTDLGFAVRAATGGFARGDWGFAVELGPTLRTFGHGQFGRWPIGAMVLGGMPWGFQVGLGTQLFKIAGDDASAAGFVGVLELDLLRLTVNRQGSTDAWWENLVPAGGRIKPASMPVDAPPAFPSGDGPSGTPAPRAPQARTTRPMGFLPGLVW